MPSPGLTNNPIKLWLTMILAIFALTAVGIAVFALIPQSMGVVYEPISAESSFTFDEWEIALSHGTISYPQGGTAVEAFQYGRLSAVVILGPGEFILTPPGDDASEFSQEVSSVILFMSPDNLSSARGNTVIKSDIYADALYEAQHMLERESANLPGVEMLGTFRHYPLDSEIKRVVMFDPQGQRSSYNESLVSRLSSPYGGKVFLSPQVKSIDPPILKALFGSLAYLIMLALLAATAFFLTLDMSPGKLYSWPSQAIIPGLSVAALQITGLALIARLRLAPIVSITWHLLMTAALLYLTNMVDVTKLWQQVRKRWIPGLLTGGMLSLLGLMLGALTLPRGLATLSWTDTGFTLIYGLLWIGLAQELLWRGIIQGALSSRFGPLRGLLFTAMAASVFSLLGAVINPTHGGLFFLEALVYIPARAVFLGFTYQRSKSIVAPITLATLLYVLPRILMF